MTLLMSFLCGLSTAEAAPRKLVLAAGQNVGDPGEEPLRYADLDAERFVQALREVAGVSGEDAVLLRSASARKLVQTLEQMNERLAAHAEHGDQLIVYISSHADEGELHLSGDHYPLKDLVDRIKRAPAGIAILIIDSCRSGLATRLKGLKPIAGSTVSLETTDVLGRAIITSSGSDEYAQESERLKGSHFTHHFVAGLRGAADSSHDGRVTLQEAYEYAYARTVETTLATRAGPQHPSFRLDLKGTGELVLSEPQAAQARLAIQIEEAGRWQVFSEDTAALVGEFQKGNGPALFALPVGRYRLREKVGARLREARVEVHAGNAVTVSENGLRETADSGPQRLKGSQAQWGLTAGASLGNALVRGVHPMLGAQLRAQRVGQLLGPLSLLAVALDSRTASSSAIHGARQTEFEAKLGLGIAFALSHDLQPWIALELGGCFGHQSGIAGGQVHQSLVPVGAMGVGLGWAFAQPFSLQAALSGGAALVRKDKLEPDFRINGMVGVAVAF